MAKNPNFTKDVGNGGTSNLKGIMTTDEATKILNCSKNASREEILSKFEKLFKANDRKAGGSFYLQSKVVRAREALESQLKKDKDFVDNMGQ